VHRASARSARRSSMPSEADQKTPCMPTRLGLPPTRRPCPRPSQRIGGKRDERVLLLRRRTCSMSGTAGLGYRGSQRERAQTAPTPVVASNLPSARRAPARDESDERSRRRRADFRSAEIATADPPGRLPAHGRPANAGRVRGGPPRCLLTRRSSAACKRSARLALCSIRGRASAAGPARISCATDELGERSVADDGRLLSQSRSGSLTLRMADGAAAVSLRFCNAIGMRSSPVVPGSLSPIVRSGSQLQGTARLCNACASIGRAL
jgi:hypothetical protein